MKLNTPHRVVRHCQKELNCTDVQHRHQKAEFMTHKVFNLQCFAYYPFRFQWKPISFQFWGHFSEGWTNHYTEQVCFLAKANFWKYLQKWKNKLFATAQNFMQKCFSKLNLSHIKKAGKRICCLILLGSQSLLWFVDRTHICRAVPHE